MQRLQLSLNFIFSVYKTHQSHYVHEKLKGKSKHELHHDEPVGVSSDPDSCCFNIWIIRPQLVDFSF